jgi:2-phospho-L-lactate guanylyltransferase
MAAMPEAPVDLARLHVVVPVRSLSDGKVRLASALDAEERSALVVGMLRRTLSVLAAWGRATAIHVVSRDPELLAMAAGAGALPVEQATGGLNEAIRVARAAAVAAGATALLVLPGDLPTLEVDSLDRLLDAADAALAAGGGRPVVALAPADAGEGTNALLCAPPAAIEPRFGRASLAAHLRAARTRGASVQLVVDAALGFDLDTPEDLVQLELGRLIEIERLGEEPLVA